MKSENNSGNHGGRGSNATSEKRDSQGRFESGNSSGSSSQKSDGRGSNAKNESRDSHGRFK